MSENSQHQVNLLDFLAFLIRWRKFLITTVLVVGVAATVIVFVIPQKFRSTAVIRSQASAGPSIGALISSKLGALGGLASQFAPSLGDVPEQTFVSILKSRWMSERVIEHFDLRSVYKMPDATFEELEKALAAHTSFFLDKETFHIVIKVDDRKPERAKAIAEFFIDELDVRNQELQSSSAQKEKEFIGQRLEEERNRLIALEDSFAQFQLSSGIVDPEEQVKATIQAAALLQAERLATQTKLEFNEMMMGKTNPENSYLQLRLASIDSSLESLIRSNRDRVPDLLLHFDDAPTQGLNYLRLKRDIEVGNLLVGFLLQQYEQAKITELRNTPTVMRLDPPITPSKRVWPRRGLLVIIACSSCLVFAIAIAMVLELLKTAGNDPSHPQYERIQNIRRSLKK
ncbi:MAG: GumC family protein [Calditrichota bacterium]